MRARQRRYRQELPIGGQRTRSNAKGTRHLPEVGLLYAIRLAGLYRGSPGQAQGRSLKAKAQRSARDKAKLSAKAKLKAKPKKGGKAVTRTRDTKKSVWSR